MAEMVAETRRLLLRDWEDEDEARFYEVMNREEVMRHLGGVQLPDEWREAYQRVRGFSHDYGHTFWIIEDRETREFLGFCGIKIANDPHSPLQGEYEMGWRLREDAWGRGYAREAATAAMDFAFGQLGAERVVALTVEGNRPSWGLMLRLGMTRRPELDYTGPDWAEGTVIVHAIGRDEWRA